MPSSATLRTTMVPGPASTLVYIANQNDDTVSVITLA
jgi:hypothetical protein